MTLSAGLKLRNASAYRDNLLTVTLLLGPEGVTMSEDICVVKESCKEPILYYRDLL